MQLKAVHRQDDHDDAGNLFTCGSFVDTATISRRKEEEKQPLHCVFAEFLSHSPFTVFLAQLQNQWQS
jgi:hypothetical protein